MSYRDNDPAGPAGAEGMASGQQDAIEAGSEGGEGSGGDSTAGGAASGAPDPAADAQRMLDEQRDKYLRLAAEYDNFRKRTLRERSEAASRGQAELLRHIIDALDDLARFAHVDPEAAEARTVVQGVEMVERKLLKALMTAGLTVVNPEIGRASCRERV